MSAEGRRPCSIVVIVGALGILTACGGAKPEGAAVPTTGSVPVANPSGGQPQAPAPPQPGATAPPSAAQPPQQPSIPHGADDTPILISDGSLWIAMNPLGGKGSGGKAMSFSNFDRQPGDTSEVREISLLNLWDGSRLTWDGIDINGVAPPVCQNPGDDCLIQIQYEGPGMDVEVSWAQDPNNNSRRKLTLRFPGRPLNQWIDWVRESHIVYHPLDWDHTARRKFTQLYLNRNPHPIDPNGNRITIHLKPEPRQ